MTAVPRRLVPALLIVAAVTSAGCSEKRPAPVMVWEFAKSLTTRREALTAVLAPPGGPVLAVGYDRPEGRIANSARCFQRTTAGWVEVSMPPAATGWSTVIRNATLAADGSVWACGRSADYEPEPSQILPVLYHYTAGVWTEVPVTGDVGGVEMLGIAAYGTGSQLVLRVACSTNFGAGGAMLKFAAGQWSRDSLPAPAGIGAEPWSLAVVARAPDGTWYAAGGRADGSGGVLYADDGVHGWRSLPGAGAYPGLQFSAIAIDPEGYPWLAGNYVTGDSLQGALFRLAGNRLSPASIARRSPGSCQLYAVTFDPYGNGWVAGGRTGFKPFVAGSSGHGWNEMLTQIEPGEGGGAVTFVTGNTLHGVCGLDAQSAFAVGYAEVFDFEGLIENEAIIYELIPRPPGDPDLVGPQAGPQRLAAPR
jgi:hypothetical protein